MKIIKRLLAILVASLLTAVSTPAEEIADRIWSRGLILTMNDAGFRAEAVAEKDGKILAVGSVERVMAHKGPETEIIDLAGRTLLPGFVDAHGHMFVGGIQALSANLLAPPDGSVTDMASLQQAVREWVAANQEAVDKVNLIFGFGYDNATLAERRHPTRDDLDQISMDIPICLWHQSGHMVAINTKALETVGITAETPDPAGGVIRRRTGTQEPDGVFEETAINTVLMKLLGQIGPKGAKVFAREGAELWARFGYTTADEGRSIPAIVNVLRQVADEGEFKIDVVTYPDVLDNRDFIKDNVSRSYKNRFRVGGAKLTIDGSPQGFTAWRDRPYYAPVGNYPPGYSGYAAAKPEQVIDAVIWAYANDIQILTHANGEAASDILISALKAAESQYGSGDRRPVLIHGQFLREDQVDSYNTLGVLPSLFPMHTYYWGDWHREHTVGPILADDISPTGWLLKRGMRFTSHHDAPVAFPDSMRVLDATVTRRTRSGDILGPDHRVAVITALKAMTIWPAWQHFEETSKGTLETGKLADFVILSDDPTAVDPENIDQIKVVETIKEGETVFVLDEGEQTGAEQILKPYRDGAGTLSRFIRMNAEWSHAYGHDPHAPLTGCGCQFATQLAAAMVGGTR